MHAVCYMCSLLCLEQHSFVFLVFIVRSLSHQHKLHRPTLARTKHYALRVRLVVRRTETDCHPLRARQLDASPA